jgi:4-amino-4-deoxy-L-arabinose transferase-like glycosyltransferase
MTFFLDHARKHLFLALLAGLALRLFFVWRYPSVAGDTAIYEELARNWLDHGVYGLTLNGRIVPVDLRAPGYPAFLAIVSLLLGRSELAVMLAQVLLDLCTCVLTAALAAALVPEAWRRHVAVPALWLAATCPFLANYCAVSLTEVLATFLATAALLCLVKAMRAPEIAQAAPGGWAFPGGAWFAAGLLTGLGALVRPETPLLLAAAGVVLVFHWRRRADWPKLLCAGVLLLAGLALALLPWAARNWFTLHRVQFLAPRYAQLEGEFVPRGFYAWTKTWLWRFRDVYTVVWKYDAEPVALGDLPVSAFDTPEERARVAQLLEAYNETSNATPELDRVFAQLAAERTARHPLRTILWVPLLRAVGIWFTPRVELLPISGHLSPLARQWDVDRWDLCVTLLFGLLNIFYLALAALGTRIVLRRATLLPPEGRPGVALLLAYVVLRTALLTQMETPEPRYVVVCFPIVFVLGALTWLKPSSSPVLGQT